MAAVFPWMTSQKLIDTVKRRIMFPVSEVTFSDDDILNFANEELMGSQVASVLQYHQEYFIQRVNVPLKQNQIRYPIPNRALGMKLRWIFYQDTNGQIYDMTRINPNDQSYFQDNTELTSNPYKYFVENNDIVLTLANLNSPVGNLVMGFYIRPNQLVTNDQAATIQNFQIDITINNAGLNPGDSISLNNNINNTSVSFVAVSSSPGINEFLIDITSIGTTTNFVNAVNTNGLYTASNGTPTTNVATIPYFSITDSFTASNSVSVIIPDTQTLVVDQVPSSFSNNTLYDFLQTLPGHRILSYDVPIGSNAISATTMTFPSGSIPNTMIIGDYVCLVNQCIIPQLPPELHNVLAERTCSRILSALGDTEGLGNVTNKIQEMETRQGNMIDNRVEGNAQKVLARKSLLHYGKIYRRTIL